MEFFPSREVFLQIGSLSIRWYAIIILFGAMLAYLYSKNKLIKAGYPSDLMDDLFVGGLGLGIVGARLWDVAFSGNLEWYFADPIRIIAVWNGGLSIQGGVILGLIFVWFYCKKKHYSFLHITDIVLPTVLIGQGIGRWGNFVNRECYGPIVDESYFNGILSFLKDGMYINHEYRMPMFFYESLLCLLGFVLIELYKNTNKKSKRGEGTFCYLVWYGAVRFWLEFNRTDSLMIGPFKSAQVASILFMLVGFAGLFGAFDKLINKEKPLIVFDLDGTLLDTEELIFQSFKHVFKKYKPDYKLTQQDRINFLGPTLWETFKQYIPECDADELVKEYRQHNWDNHAKYVKPIDHVPELLEQLHNQGYQMAIASSKAKSVVILGLQCCKLDQYFNPDNIIGCDEVTKFKPDPEVIIKAYRSMNRSMDNTIYIGDTKTDITAGNRAGVYTIGYVANEEKRQSLLDAKANVVVDDMANVIEVLKERHPWSHNMK